MISSRINSLNYLKLRRDNFINKGSVLFMDYFVYVNGHRQNNKGLIHKEHFPLKLFDIEEYNGYSNIQGFLKLAKDKKLS